MQTIKTPSELTLDIRTQDADRGCLFENGDEMQNVAYGPSPFPFLGKK